MKTLITPFQTHGDLTIQIVNDADAAERWRDKGYTPIECSFGPRSVVDDLELDHHGSLSHLEGVAVRAYRDCFGKRREKPKFVTTGFPDEDATWAMCALAGIIPHPNMAELYPDAPPAMKTLARQNLLHVAETINAVDVNPDLAPTLVDTFWGRMVLGWRQQGHPTCSDRLAWYGGVDRWRTIMTAQSDEMVNAAAASQDERLAEVGSARCERVSPNVVVVDFSTLGRNSSFYQVWLKEAPVLVAFIGGPEGKGICSFVGRDMETLDGLLGSGGFIPHYASLEPSGCGGREIIGGTSRSIAVNWEQALAYGARWNELIEAHQAS